MPLPKLRYRAVLHGGTVHWVLMCCAATPLGPCRNFAVPGFDVCKGHHGGKFTYSEIRQTGKLIIMDHVVGPTYFRGTN